MGGDIPFIGEKSPSDLLRCMLNRKIDLLTVVGDRSLTSEEADKIIELLWGAASEMGQIDVLKELTNVRTMGADPLADVPEVMPVQITKVCLESLFTTRKYLFSFLEVGFVRRSI